MRTVPELPRRRGGALNHGRPGVPPLRNGMWRRVREAAPYMGWNLRDGRVRAPAPTANLGAVSFFVGAGHWPARGSTLCAPTEKKEAYHECSLGGRIPPPLCGTPPLTRGLWRKGQIPIPSVSLYSTSPLDKRFRSRVGEALGSPAVNGPSTVGSANPGAEIEPHRRQFLQTQGPVARREFRHPLKFCAPEMLHIFP